MAHSTADILKAQDDAIKALEALIAIHRGKIAAWENGIRAVKMGAELIDEPMDLPSPETRRTIKDLASKMVGNGP